jgi:hypothetical protein
MLLKYERRGKFNFMGQSFSVIRVKIGNYPFFENLANPAKPIAIYGCDGQQTLQPSEDKGGQKNFC